MTANLTLMSNGMAMVGCWLVAGVFFTFSDFVMKSFRALSASNGIRAMQMINRQVHGSMFLFILFAVAAVSAFLTAYAAMGLSNAGSIWMAAGCVIYLLAVVICTIAANVPMNQELAGLDASTDASADYWAGYLSRWTRYNHLRTAGSVVAALCFSYAFVLQVPQ